MATILIIEDHETALGLCKIMLGENHQVLEARNSDEALKMLKETRLDLIITDLLVPNSGGFFPTHDNAVEFVASLRTTNNTVKIAVYSVLCYEPKLQKKAIALGADVCLIKMGSMEIFKQTINNLLGLDQI